MIWSIGSFFISFLRIKINDLINLLAIINQIDQIYILDHLDSKIAYSILINNIYSLIVRQTQYRLISYFQIIQKTVMKSTFTIQNMETYFNNYIPCNQHRKQPITNFCTQSPCLKFLCPECVEIHSTVHANHTIQSIKTCIKKTSERLKETIEKLEYETNRNSFLKSDSTDQYTKQLIKQLQEVKEGLIQQIKAYFKEKEYEIRKETSKYTLIQKKLQSLKKDLLQATVELKMLQKNLFVPQQTLKAIKKANKLNYPGMVHHFHGRIDEVESQMTFNIRLQMNNEKRQALKSSLNELIGIKNKIGGNAMGKKRTYQNNNRTQPFEGNQSKAHQKSRQINLAVNSPILSADRLLQSFRIDAKNYFESEPFLHFFQVSNQTLHTVRIDQIKLNQPVRWQIQQLNTSMTIPSFHRTVSTSKGMIYLIGGTNVQTLKRSKDIYRYDKPNKTLVKVAELLVARSSHSIVYHNGLIFISGGMTNNDETLKKCQVFDPRTEEVKSISSSKYATTNSCLSAIGKDYLVKFGGVYSNGENNNTIEVYSIKADVWFEADPTIQNHGQFGLLSCSGWAPLNQSQIFVFGGYNQEIQSENSRLSFVIQHSPQENQFLIKYVNQKNPPFAQGFWNQQGIIHNGSIYCLQNVDGEEQNDCLEDKRALLIFNGKNWSTCIDGSH